jgi:hypothetical protein
MNYLILKVLDVEALGVKAEDLVHYLRKIITDLFTLIVLVCSDEPHRLLLKQL